MKLVKKQTERFNEICQVEVSGVLDRCNKKPLRSVTTKHAVLANNSEKQIKDKSGFFCFVGVKLLS